MKGKYFHFPAQFVHLLMVICINLNSFYHGKHRKRINPLTNANIPNAKE